MKLVFKEYVAALRERDELDVVLPDLLSELGYNVISRPGRGTDQGGVDVLAVSPADKDGKKKLYAFTIKKGNLTRDDWSNGNQSLVSSIDDIVFKYFKSCVPTELQDLEKVICICFGGDVAEPMRSRVSGLTETYTRKYDVSFEEWNGDKLAELLSTGILREQLVSKSLRSYFQKSVAMLDEPEVSYENFSILLKGLLPKELSDRKRCLSSLRQTYVCLSVLYIWARDAGNLEAPYRASELSILHAWEFIKTRSEGPESINLRRTFRELLHLHFRIWDEYFGEKIIPLVGRRHALSAAVNANSPVDTNLKLFEILGRLAQRGLWMLWEADQTDIDSDLKSMRMDNAKEISNHIVQLVDNNECLFSPCTDMQSVEISTALFFLSHFAEVHFFIREYCEILLDRYHFAYASHDRYPTHISRYRDLISHPLEKTDAYRQWHTSGSTLIPLLVLWAGIHGPSDNTQVFAQFAKEALRHCNPQFWMVSKDSEDYLYTNDQRHGATFSEIPITADGELAMQRLQAVCDGDAAYSALSVIEARHDPIVVMACRHYRLPLPPQVWVGALRELRSSGAKQLP